MGVDISSDTGDDGDVDDYVTRGGKTHFGDGPRGRVNHCFGNVSAAETLKVKLLPIPCLPIKKDDVY